MSSDRPSAGTTQDLANTRNDPGFRQKIQDLVEDLVKRNKVAEAVEVVQRYNIGHWVLVHAVSEKWRQIHTMAAFMNAFCTQETEKLLNFCLKEGQLCDSQKRLVMRKMLVGAAPSCLVASFLRNEQVDLEKIIHASSDNYSECSPLYWMLLGNLFGGLYMQPSDIRAWRTYAQKESVRTVVLLVHAGITTIQRTPSEPLAVMAEPQKSGHSSAEDYNFLACRYLHLAAFEFFVSEDRFFEVRLLYDTGAVSYKELFYVWRSYSSRQALSETGNKSTEEDVNDTSEDEDEKAAKATKKMPQRPNRMALFLQGLNSAPRSLISLCAIRVSSLIGCPRDREQRVSSLGLAREHNDQILFKDAISHYVEEKARQI